MMKVDVEKDIGNEQCESQQSQLWLLILYPLTLCKHMILDISIKRVYCMQVTIRQNMANKKVDAHEVETDSHVLSIGRRIN